MTPGPVDRRRFMTAFGAAVVAGPPAFALIVRSRGQSLRERLVPYVERGEVPGLVAAVVREGREEFHVLGVRMVGKPDVVKRDTIFRIASMTKPVTAAAAMMLIEEGKLGLDEPVDRLLPELANRKVLKRLDGPLDDVDSAKRAITVRDLLTFRMGFGILMAPPGTYPIQKATDELELGQGVPAPAKPPAPDEWVRRFATLPLMHQPGERWLYHTGADVLGVVIARASGRPLDILLKERLFDPLRMHDTGFSVPAFKLHRFVASYMVNPQSAALELYDPPDGQWSRPPAFPSGGGGLVSTVPDYLRFASLLLGRGALGSTRLLSAASVEQITTDALTPANKAFGALAPGYFENHGCGFGMAVVTGRDELERPPGSYGWDGGLGTSWYNEPSTRTIGILLTQRAWTDPTPPPLFREFWRAVSARGERE
jgi:CubicO group peptidase (beta-lactamase class C family)